MTFEGDSALIVPIPAADPVIHRWRVLHDSAAAAGVLAHVTVLFPFVPRAEIDGEVEATVTRVLAPFPAFVCRLAEVRWFGDEVAYLAPEPDVTFRRVLTAMWAAFPDHPPYEGVHAAPTPHVTIGHQGPGLDEAVRAVEETTADRIGGRSGGVDHPDGGMVVHHRNLPAAGRVSRVALRAVAWLHPPKGRRSECRAG